MLFHENVLVLVVFGAALWWLRLLEEDVQLAFAFFELIRRLVRAETCRDNVRLWRS